MTKGKVMGEDSLIKPKREVYYVIVNIKIVCNYSTLSDIWSLSSVFAHNLFYFTPLHYFIHAFKN